VFEVGKNKTSLYLGRGARLTVTMATKLPFKTTFEPERVIQPIFTGGSVALDNDARILATTLGEDAVLTDLTNGKQYAKIEGDGEPISTLTCMCHAR